MSHPALFARRAAIVLAVALVLGFGFFAIRVASAWTAASAALAVSPPSVAALQEQLDAERARSAVLTAEIDRLVADSDQLSAAIAAARTQIEQETANTAEVSAASAGEHEDDEDDEEEHEHEEEHEEEDDD
jgi:hypothetical protein